METTVIEGLGRPVSRIGLGTWSMGGVLWGGSDTGACVHTIHAALDMGINLIDTAPIYGFGLAEEIVGQALVGRRREEVVIATKAGLTWEDECARDSSRDRIEHEISESLRRLRTDYIDIYQIHWPDPSHSFGEAADAMMRLREQGLIRAIGVSNFTPAQHDAFAAVAPIHTTQPPYNLFEREAEVKIVPYCRAYGIAVLGYGVLCRGLLGGRLRPGTRFAEDDIRGRDPKFQPPRFEQYLAAVGELDRLAHERFGRRVVHLAARWALDQGVDVALWGARRPEQLEPVLEVMGWTLDDETRRAIDVILARCIRDPVGPEFMAPPV